MEDENRKIARWNWVRIRLLGFEFVGCLFLVAVLFLLLFKYWIVRFVPYQKIKDIINVGKKVILVLNI